MAEQWQCPNCGATNYVTDDRCLSCDFARAAQESGASGDGEQVGEDHEEASEAGAHPDRLPETFGELWRGASKQGRAGMVAAVALALAVVLGWHLYERPRSAPAFVPPPAPAQAAPASAPPAQAPSAPAGPYKATVTLPDGTQVPIRSDQDVLKSARMLPQATENAQAEQVSDWVDKVVDDLKYPESMSYLGQATVPTLDISSRVRREGVGAALYTCQVEDAILNTGASFSGTAYWLTLQDLQLGAYTGYVDLWRSQRSGRTWILAGNVYLMAPGQVASQTYEERSMAGTGLSANQ